MLKLILLLMLNTVELLNNFLETIFLGIILSSEQKSIYFKYFITV